MARRLVRRELFNESFSEVEDIVMRLINSDITEKANYDATEVSNNKFVI
ncbi:hypothetical protein [Staphylococcus rostri]|nr:hypothetical protein [Staphylococcus rostri]